jgi:hypothetical protein
MMTIEIYQTSVGEAADTIATAQRLIEAGVLTGDDELINIGKAKWLQVWPPEIANLAVDKYIKDLRKEIASPNQTS